MSGRVVSDIQTRAEGESLYIRYNTDANVVNDLINDSSYEFIGEVILKINVGPIDDKYIVTYIDYYSSYPEAVVVTDMSSQNIIKKLINNS